MSTDKEIQVQSTNETQNNSVEKMLMVAIQKNVPVETLEKLLAMRRELRAEAAKEVFDREMSMLQGELPIIKKNKAAKNKFGVALYHYAPIEAIVEQVKEPIAKHGFSYSFKTEITVERVKVICTVKHESGHSEPTDIEVPLTNLTEIMSKPQQVAATVTFAKRHAFKNAFGIETEDEDTDAQGEEKKSNKATQEQFDKIDKLAADLEITKAAVIQRCKELYGIPFAAISAVQADGIIEMLTKKMKEKNTTK